MWRQRQTDFLPMIDQPCRFDVQLRVNFVVEYLPHHINMNVRSEKKRVLLERRDLVDDLKVHETMSTILKYTAPVTDSELERIVEIVSSKAKTMDADSCNAGRDVIFIIMSLRVVYLKDYTEDVELAWAARLGLEAPESMKRIIPALDSAVSGLDKVVYDKGSCSEEQCAICLVRFGVGKEIHRTPCVHDFHRTCIAKWLKRSHLCPLCRFPLPVCGNTEALCPFKEERPLPSNRRVYRTKPRMSTRPAPLARRQVFDRRTDPNPPKDSKPSSSTSNLSTKSQSKSLQSSPNSKPKSRSWSVYLILSTNTPIKTYVGVSTDFSRRLKHHNGELKGGAKASRIGRPWVSACIIRGFHDQSEELDVSGNFCVVLVYKMASSHQFLCYIFQWSRKLATILPSTDNVRFQDLLILAAS
ncbi:hypothetical protein QYF36_024250 [Acer negundo]|nr:hypothetical protein QYF36_024250 [Acer negundo]